MSRAKVSAPSASSITVLSVAVLALLAERRMHPYEMLQTLTERRADRVVKLRQGSLYHAVDRLERDGFIVATGTAREGNRPARTTYRLEPSGRTALSEWVSIALRSAGREYAAFPVALAEAHNLSAPMVSELLESRRAGLRAEWSDLRAELDERFARGTPEVFSLELDYSLHMLDAEIAWIGAMLERLRAGAMAWPDQCTTGSPGPE